MTSRKKNVLKWELEGLGDAEQHKDVSKFSLVFGIVFVLLSLALFSWADGASQEASEYAGDNDYYSNYQYNQNTSDANDYGEIGGMCFIIALISFGVCIYQSGKYKSKKARYDLIMSELDSITKQDYKKRQEANRKRREKIRKGETERKRIAAEKEKKQTDERRRIAAYKKTKDLDSAKRLVEKGGIENLNRAIGIFEKYGK